MNVSEVGNTGYNLIRVRLVWLLDFFLNIGHINLIWVFLVNKNISINKFQAILEQFHLNIKDGGEIGIGLIFVDEFIKIDCFLVVDKKTSHQKDKGYIYNRIVDERIIKGNISFID